MFSDGLIFNKKLQLCLNSFYSFESQSRFKNIQPVYHETYIWFFNHQVGFEDWLEGKISNNIYWIQKKPGSGKSTIMKYVMSHPLIPELLKKYNGIFWVIAGFFFHDRGTAVQKSAEKFLRQVLYQVINQQKQLFVLIYSFFTKILDHQKRSSDRSKLLTDEWTFSTLRETLTLIGRKSIFEINFCLFVDVLDEHDGNHKCHGITPAYKAIRPLTLPITCTFVT